MILSFDRRAAKPENARRPALSPAHRRISVSSPVLAPTPQSANAHIVALDDGSRLNLRSATHQHPFKESRALRERLQNQHFVITSRSARTTVAFGIDEAMPFVPKCTSRLAALTQAHAPTTRFYCSSRASTPREIPTVAGEPAYVSLALVEPFTAPRRRSPRSITHSCDNPHGPARTRSLRLCTLTLIHIRSY